MGEGFASSGPKLRNAGGEVARGARRPRGILEVMGRCGLLAIAAIAFGAAGCSEFNTTIGTPTPAATIAILSPGSINAGGPPFILTVDGGTFVSNSVVQWNFSNLTTTFVSANQLTAVVPASLIAQATTADITVNTPGSAQSNPQQGILIQDESNVLPFLVSGNGNPIPTITSPLAPASNSAGSAFTLKVTGTQFVQGAVVNWAYPISTPLTTTFVSATEVDAAVTCAQDLPAGSARVSVTNPVGGAGNTGGGTSNTLNFTITPLVTYPVPAIATLSPNSAVAGSATQTLTINGGCFVPGSSVTYNNVAHAANYVSPSVLTIPLSAGDQSTAGNYPVVVTNPGPGGGSSNSVSFAITAAQQQGNARKNGVSSTGLLSATASTGPLSPAISADHRYLAFVASEPDPSSDASTGPTNVYVRDTCAGAAAGCTPATTLISVAADGSAADGPSSAPSISADGRYVSFASTADNLIAGGSSGQGEIFIRDTCAGAPTGCVPATSLVSIAADGSFANGPSDSPYLSANGRYVVFESSATNLATNTVSSSPGIFMRDLCTNGPAGCQASTVLLSVSGASVGSP